MGSSPANLTAKLGQVSLLPLQEPNYHVPRFEKLLSQIDGDDITAATEEEDTDFILSQDFFCTPDYITPEEHQISRIFDSNKENIACPKSPEKITTDRSKRRRQEGLSGNFLGSNFPCHLRVAELHMDAFGSEDSKAAKPLPGTGTQKLQKYVSKSAVALRCRVMPPLCINNPYLCETAGTNLDLICNRRSKATAAGIYPSVVEGTGLSRYHTDFHEIEEIGCGNFSRVFKVLKRIDGCIYAVKHSIRQLHHDTERRRALMEVQALAALGSHENIVGYFTSWFENEQLYIQMEICDHSLSISRSGSPLPTERDVIKALHQIAQALQFIHGRGIAHLDIKPDNIYVKNGVYKLGDFGCATLINGNLPVEEGDARYMPLEILNDKYDCLDKVDIFSLGASFYELVKGSPLPASGSQFSFLREGKISLLPGYSLQFQNLLKALMDPDPAKRPSAKELVENPIFKANRDCRK